MGALSKGCGTCKKRKVKCDETHPKCTRCRVAGMECTGFVPRHRFVHEEPRIRRRAAVIQAQFQEFSAKRSNSHLYLHSSQIYSPRPLLPETYLPTALPLTAFKDDIFISFLIHKFFEDKTPRPSYGAAKSSCGLPVEWTQELIATPQKPRLKSWDALAATVFGQANKSYDVIKSALRLYWQALSELRVQLSDPHNQHSNSTLASVTALYIYQMIVSRSEISWTVHIGGLGGIFLSRGPQVLKTHVGRRMFLEHRITLVAKAIMSGQRTFLRQRVWKIVPWKDDMKSKSAMDYLVDILADIAEYLADIKAFHHVTLYQDLEWTQLRIRVALCVEELNDWWWQWEADHPQAVTEVHSRQAAETSVLPILLEYETLTTAYELCFHNTVRIFLLQLCNMLQLLPDQIPSTDHPIILDKPNSTILLGISSDAQGLAREIFQSLNYCYAKSRRFIFTFSFLFIQEVAYGCFASDSDEAKWINSQDWAGLVPSDDVQDANLLGTLLPRGMITLV